MSHSSIFSRVGEWMSPRSLTKMVAGSGSKQLSASSVLVETLSISVHRPAVRHQEPFVTVSKLIFSIGLTS